MESPSERQCLLTTNQLLICCFFVLFSCSNHVSESKSTAADAPSSKDGAITDTTAAADAGYDLDTSKRYIYITLDDGPQPGTMNCYHVLRNENIKASFFMIAVQTKDKSAKLKADSVKAAYPQFLLCNHSYTHADYNHYKRYYGNADSALRDIMKAEDTLHLNMKIFRTPGNNSWAINGRIRTPKLTHTLTWKADSAGYRGIGWDVEWHFKGSSAPLESTDVMLRQVENIFNSNECFQKKHLVILAHDRMFQKEQYADSLKKFVAILKQDPRNVFETIDKYPGVMHKN